MVLIYHLMKFTFLKRLHVTRYIVVDKLTDLLWSRDASAAPESQIFRDVKKFVKQDSIINFEPRH